jgi:hypothetical protein
VLTENFTTVHHTVGMPKGRNAASAYLRDLVEDVKASGLSRSGYKQAAWKGPVGRAARREINVTTKGDE